MNRKPFVGGNWKMNGSKSFIEDLTKSFNEAELDTSLVDICIAPPAVYIPQLLDSLRKDWIVAAQNCHSEEKGAFTGELAPKMLLDIGLKWVILGHSERRHVFGESIEVINTKLIRALEAGLSVIYCVGELLEDRQGGKTEEVVFSQIEILKNLPKESLERVVIAYEPVWAIGTGVVATPDQAEETHGVIRRWIAENVATELSESIRIIYGGSVKPENSTELYGKENVDGFLVGGASLVPSFVEIVRSTIQN